MVGGEIFSVSHPLKWYTLCHNEFMFLRLGAWIFEHVLDAYMLLLRDREEYYREREIKRWAQFAFLGSFFMHFGKNCVPPTEINRATSFCQPYVYSDVGLPLHECDYIFMPVCNTVNCHFILVIFSVAEWVIIILDLLSSDTKYMKIQEMYKEFVDVAVQLIPFCLRIGNPMRK